MARSPSPIIRRCVCALVAIAALQACDSQERAQQAPAIAGTAAQLTENFDVDWGSSGVWIETGAEPDWTLANAETTNGDPGASSPVASASACGSWLNSNTCILELAQGIDMTGSVSGTLEFARYVNSAMDTGSDYLRVEINRSGSWQTLDTFGDQTGEDDDLWHNESYVLTAADLASTSWKVRFVARASTSSEIVQIDNVVVSLVPDAVECFVDTDCDDSNECTQNNCISGACEYPNHAPSTACSLGVCDGSGSCVECLFDSQCPDDVGDACTVPFCDQGTNTCSLAPQQCDTSSFCAPETCDPAIGCVPDPPVIDDMVPCTIDSCDEAGDQVVHLPDDSACPDTGDNNECTVGVCNPGDPGADPNGCAFAPVPDGTSCPAISGGVCFQGNCVECITGADCWMDEICAPATNTCECGLTCDDAFAGQCGTWVEISCRDTVTCSCDPATGEVCTPYSGSSNGVCAQPCSNRTLDAGEGGRDCGGTCATPCTELVCIDGADDDGDGLIDCDDADCRDAGECDRCEPAVLGTVSYPIFIPEFFNPPSGTPGVLEFELADPDGYCAPLGPATLALGSTGAVELSSADAGFDTSVACLRSRPFVVLRFRDPASEMTREAQAAASELFTQALDDDGVLTAMRLVVSHSSYDTNVRTLAVDFHWEALGHDRFHLDCLPCGDFAQEPLSPSFCTGQCRCDIGEGGCQRDGDCRRGLVCADAAPLYGIQVGDMRVCVHPSCDNGQQDGDETGVDCGGTLCGACPADCSAEPGCSPQCPCDDYEGPCDRDEDCGAGSKCGVGVGARFGLPLVADVCWPDSCDEDSCGSAACGPCEACDYQVTDCVVGGGTRVETVSFGTTSLRDTPATFINDAAMVEYVGKHVLRKRGGLALFEGAATNYLINSVHPERFNELNVTTSMSAVPAPWSNSTAAITTPYAVRVTSTGAGENALQQTAAVPYRPRALATFSSFTNGGGQIALDGVQGGPLTSMRSIFTGSENWNRNAITGYVIDGSTPTSIMSIGTYGAGGVGSGVWAQYAMPQLELGPFGTSYIPTVGTSAERGTDHVVLDGRALPDWFFQGRWSMQVDPLWDVDRLMDSDQRFVLFEFGGDAEQWIGFESTGATAGGGGSAWIRLVVQAGSYIRRSAPFALPANTPLTITVGPSEGYLDTDLYPETFPSQEVWSWPRDFVSVGARGSGGAHESAYAWLGEPSHTVDIPETCDVQTYDDGTPCGGGGPRVCIGGGCELSSQCGDGIVNDGVVEGGVPFPAEECDDGNNATGDGCTPECQSEVLTVVAGDVALHEPGISTHAVAADGQGRLLFVWQSIEGDVSRLLAARATPAGVPVAADVQSPLVIAGDLGAGWPAEPQVVGHPAGGWTVVWTSGVEDGDASRAVYRYVDPAEANGMPPSPARLVHPEDTETARHERSARVGALADGFVVAWVDERTLFGPEAESSVKARLFDHAGATVGSVIDVSDESSSQELRPTVGAIGNQWMAAWVRLDDDSLRLRRFSGSSALEGEQIAAYDARAPAAVGLPSASSLTDFALAYSHASDHRIYVIELLGGYVPSPSDAFRLTPRIDARPEEHPTLATLGDDAFVVAFGYGDGYRDSDFRVVERSSHLYSPQAQEMELLGQLQDESNQRDVKLAAVPGGVWFSWTDDGASSVPGPIGAAPTFPHQLRAYLLPCPDCAVATAAHCFDDPTILVPDGLADGEPYAYGGARFGERVVVRGEWAFVSAPRDDDPDNWSGTVHVYRNQEGVWSLHQQLWGAPPVASDRYGSSLDVDGNILVVGAATRTFVHHWLAESGFWELRQELLHGDATSVPATSVAVSGDAIVVGDAETDQGLAPGTLYVFRRNIVSDTWSEEATIDATGTDGPGALGISVDMRGDRIVAGAGIESTPEEGYLKGAAYVFERGPAGWEQTARLQPEDIAPSYDWTLIGTPMLFYGGGVQLVGDDGLLVTAVLDSNVYDGAGSVYWYRFDGSAWVEHDKLLAPDAGPATMFGQSIDSDGHTLVVGALGGGLNQGFTNALPPDSPGSAYVFHRDPARDGWIFDRRVQAPAPRDTDMFGSDVAVHDGGLLIGAAAMADANGDNPGALLAYTCAPARNCGDGLVTGTEECDDGNVVTETCPPGQSCAICTDTCALQFPLCGNGVQDPPIEECDDGPGNGPAYCEFGAQGTECQVCGSTCTLVAGGYCGDGIVNGLEECDDGNDVSGDGCETNCLAACDLGAAELCNGLDDDCDGTTDEAADADCDDDNVCTANSCVGGACQSTNVPGSCDDDNACTDNDSCVAGSCQGSNITCTDDGNECTDSSCNPLSGCVVTNNTNPCDDADPCTTGDVCGGGTCAGTALGCQNGDSCCPASCNANNDDACVAECGNGVVEPPDELCDGDCPLSCPDLDGDACTVETLVGDPAMCTAQCQTTTITTCGGAEGCCPDGCTTATDPDCGVECGNGVVEGTETCDGNCPTSCPDDGNACTLDVPVGDPADCNVECHTPITACESGDGCCPGGCTRLDDIECAPSGSASAKLESGWVPALVGSAPVTVTLANTYESPVVVAIIHNTDGVQDAVIARVTAVTANSFQVYLQSASVTGVVQPSRVSYLVVEEGTFDIDGMRIEAHRFWSTVTDGQNSWVGELRTYSQAYSSPVVLGQVMSDNDPRFSAFWSADQLTEDNAPTSTSLRIGKHRGEDPVQTRADEILGYIVIEAGSGTLAGVPYQVAASAAVAQQYEENNAHEVLFATPFDQGPEVVVGTQTGMIGSDGAWTHLRGDVALEPRGFYVFSDEDQLGEPERVHAAERVSYLALARPVAYPAPTCGDGTVQFPEVCDDGNTVTEYCPAGAGCCAADCTALAGFCGDGKVQPGEACDDGNTSGGDGCDPGCTIADPIVVAGTVEASSSRSTVSLARPVGQRPFARPVVVATVQYANNDADSVIARVENVTPTSFDVSLQSGSGGAAPSPERVHYLVVDEGAWTVDGVNLEAWRFDTRHASSDYHWIGERRDYGHSYTAPRVFGQVMSVNDATGTLGELSAFWSSGQVPTQAASATHLYVGQHVGEDDTPWRADPETLGYIVIEAGRGTLGGMEFEAGDDASVSDYDPVNPRLIQFTNLFDRAPEVVIASQTGMIGAQGSWASLYGDPATGTERTFGFVDEDQLRDAERDHPGERVAFLALQRRFAYPAPTCGNGVTEFPEICDDGNTTTEYCADPTCCRADCSGPSDHCGDGIMQAGEACDDGNLLDGDGCSLGCTVADPKLQADVIAAVGATPVTVTLDQSYANPVVVTTVHYRNNTDSIVARVDNVGPTSFDVYLQTTASGGSVVPEKVSYLVVEQGAWNVDGLALEAWRFSSDHAAHDGYWIAEERGYGHAYVSPAVLGQVMSATDPAFQVFWANGGGPASPPNASRLHVGKHVGEDDSPARPTPEEIGYVVLESGAGVLGGLDYSVGVSGYVFSGPPPVDGSAALLGAFEHAPAVIVGSQAGQRLNPGSWFSLHGDPAASSSTFYGIADEDQLRDAERDHADEAAAFLALEGPLAIPAPICGDGVQQVSEVCDDGNAATEAYGCPTCCVADCSGPTEYCGDGILQQAAGEACDDGNAASGDSCTPDCQYASPKIETGTVLVGATPVTINLANTYATPVVVTALQVANSTAAVVPRVTSVTATSFDLYLQSPSPSGSAQTELVTYMVVEQGAWEIDGVPIEAWRFDSEHTASDSYWIPERRDYANSYAAPLVFGQVMSANNPEFQVFWTSSSVPGAPPTPTEIYVGKHAGEDDEPLRPLPETIGYVVMETGAGTLGGVPFTNGQVANVSGYDGGATSIPLSPPFASAPSAALVSQAGQISNNGGWASLYGSPATTPSSLSAVIDEDQLHDAERTHGNESVSYLAFETQMSLWQAACGNQIVEPGEECDDGNSVPNDGCEPNCAFCLPTAIDDVTCDGIDDDCDGAVDEDCVSACTLATATLADHVSAGRAYVVQSCPPGTIFSDGFEDASLSNWIIGGPNADATRQSSPVGSGSYSGRLRQQSWFQTGALDTSSYSNVTLQYWRTSESMESSDTFSVLYRTGGSGAFTAIASESTADDFPTEVRTVSGLPSAPSLELRFASATDTSFDRVFIDDVLLSGTAGCTDEYFAVGSDELLGTGPSTVVDLRQLTQSSGWATVATDDVTCDGEDDDCDGATDEDCPPAGFQESAGQVVMEAESWHRNTAGTAHTWDQFTSSAGASGGFGMRPMPDSGVDRATSYASYSPRLDFDINFAQTGTYYVWVRSYAGNTSGDTLHVGIDGAETPTADNLGTFPTGAYNWLRSTTDGPVATLDVATPGIHTLSLWMREDGTYVDKIVLTTDSGYTPSGTGPAESTDLGPAQ